MTGWTVLAAITSASLFAPAWACAGPPETSKPKPKTKTETESRDKSPSKSEKAILAVLEAHNRERAAEKLPPLSLDPKLTAAAEVHAKDMAAHARMTHDGSDGSTPVDRIKRQDYPYHRLGENVAEGYRTVKALMSGWMNSPPHRANILGEFSQVGFAVAHDSDDVPYWCADFGAPIPRLEPAHATDDLVKALNAERAAADLPPLKPRVKLHEAAAQVAQASAAAESITTKARGDDFLAIVNRVGYRFLKVGESSASGQPTVAEVVKSWMASSSRKDQILGDFTEIGVGYALSKTDTPFWCLILATPAR